MAVAYHISTAPDGTDLGFHDAYLSQNGDVWYVDSGGLQGGKMDPRTATWTDYPVGGPNYRGHGLTQDASRDICVAGHTGFLRVHGKTGELQRYPYDPTAEKPRHGHT